MYVRGEHTQMVRGVFVVTHCALKFTGVLLSLWWFYLEAMPGCTDWGWESEGQAVIYVVSCSPWRHQNFNMSKIIMLETCFCDFRMILVIHLLLLIANLWPGLRKKRWKGAEQSQECPRFWCKYNYISNVAIQGDQPRNCDLALIDYSHPSMIYISHMCFSRKLLAFWSLRQAKKTCRMKYIWIYRRRGVDPGFVSPYEQKLGCVLQVSLVPNWSSCCLWISISSSLALRVNGCPFVDFHWLPDGSGNTYGECRCDTNATQLCARCIHNAYGLCFVRYSEEETAKRCIEAPLKIIDLYILTQEEKNGLEWFWVVLTLQVF